MEGRNELSIGVDGAIGPDVTELRIVARFQVFFLFADVAPNFVHFQAGAFKVPHFGVHERRAAVPDLQAKAHYRIAVNARHTLD